MRTKKQEEEPPLTVEYEDGISATRSPGSDALPETSPNGAKRKRRTAIEMFADKKQGYADLVSKCEQAVKQAEADLQAAIDAEEQFLTEARAALGM